VVNEVVLAACVVRCRASTCGNCGFDPRRNDASIGGLRRRAVNTFQVQIADVSKLRTLIHQLAKVDGLRDVERV
jgi:hypothetical protein